MSEPRQAPRGGWLLATLASTGLVVLLSLIGVAALDTLSIDLRHRWVALTAPDRAPHETVRSAPAIGMNVFLEQEVEPDKRQLSLDLLHAAGVTWIRQELPWEQIEPVAKGQTVDPNFG
ncbi:MAG TPA: hypothetical protein VFG86_15105, partial [Chloroflexota bacterium]|nr:hypothetical protein [Chloroflexota bacterium]